MKLQESYHTPYKRHLLLRAVKECETQSRLTNRQGHTGHPRTRAQIKQPGRGWQEATLQEIQRLDDEDVDDPFGLTQPREIQVTTPVQQRES